MPKKKDPIYAALFALACNMKIETCDLKQIINTCVAVNQFIKEGF